MTIQQLLLRTAADPTYAVSLSDRTISALDTGASASPFAEASILLAADGILSRRTGNSIGPGTWTSPAPGVEWGQTGITGADYEVYVSYTGDVPTGVVNTWIDISAERAWSLLRNTEGTSTSALTMSIRKIGTTTILAAATITLNATVGQL